MVENRVVEAEVRDEILRLLVDGRIWTNANIKKELRKRLPLSPDDKARANKRDNEEKWEELVNNALSPSRPNSLHAQKHVEYVEGYGKGHHRITDAGRTELEEKNELRDITRDVVREFFPTGIPLPKKN